MNDLVVIGGGVIGLSLAYELSGRGWRVAVVDVPRPGRASWAGAGILVPANEATAIHPLDKLRGLSSRLHREWSSELREDLGCDNGYLACGGLYVARTPGEIAALRGVANEWAEFQIEHRWLDQDELGEHLPFVNQLPESSKPCHAVWVDSEAQIGIPQHLEALTRGCRQRGVTMVDQGRDVRLHSTRTQLNSVEVDGRSIKTAYFCVTAGAWSTEILQQIGVAIPLVPVRGQMVLYRLPRPLFEPVIYDGSRYLVPRRDGYVLAGSTIEEVGFNVSTVRTDIDQLKSFASGLVPALDEKAYQRCWAGLRPATVDGFPYMGRIPGWSNGFISTGHFKSGLQLSTGSAVVMADLIEGKPALVDLSPFDPARAMDQLTESQLELGGDGFYPEPGDTGRRPIEPDERSQIDAR